MNLIRLAISASLASLISGCGNYIAATRTLEVAYEVTYSGVMGKVFFDPVWDFFFGQHDTKEVENLKIDLAKLVAEKILDAIVPTAQAGNKSFKCKADEPQQDCQLRATSEAEFQFNIYAAEFVAAFNRCRHTVVLGYYTQPLDYTDQVRAITQCISDAGYEQEVLTILNYVDRSR